MDTFMLLIQKEQQNRNSVGRVNQRARSIGLKLRLMILFTTLIFVSGCSSFSMLVSGGSFAVSQNSYAKMYNAADMLTMMSTKKGIKTHAYEKGKKYIYDNTLGLFGNKH
jgi:uncharacterized protein YceK